MDVKFHAVESDFFGTASEGPRVRLLPLELNILRSVSGFGIYRKVYREQ